MSYLCIYRGRSPGFHCCIDAFRRSTVFLPSTTGQRRHTTRQPAATGRRDGRSSRAHRQPDTAGRREEIWWEQLNRGYCPKRARGKREERTMTAATGKGANRGHVAPTQHTDPVRTTGRSPVSGRPQASGRLESASRLKSRSRPEGAGHPPGMERISVALIPKVVDALQRLQARTNLSKTDLVNRALTLLDFFEAQRDSDRDILIRNNDTQEVQSVMLL